MRLRGEGSAGVKGSEVGWARSVDACPLVLQRVGQALPPASQVVMVAAEQEEEVQPGRGSYLQH